MKKLHSFLFLSVLLFISALSARDIPVIAPSDVSEISPVASPSEKVSSTSHLYPVDRPGIGISIRYPLLTLEKAVTAVEYCDFLNDEASHDGSWKFAYIECFYDQELMDPDSPSACIVRSKTKENYQYAVREGCDNQIINSVDSSYAAVDFLNWQRSKILPMLPFCPVEVSEF